MSAQPDLVTVTMQENEEISEPVRERLVAMVGDADPQVRLQTAVTLHNMNYAGALGALLTQLAQERDDRIIIALAAAVAPIEDPASVPALLDVLNTNPPPPVAIAVVRALGASSRGLRASDPALANAVAGRLRQIVRPRRNAAGDGLLAARASRKAKPSACPVSDATCKRRKARSSACRGQHRTAAAQPARRHCSVAHKASRAEASITCTCAKSTPAWRHPSG